MTREPCDHPATDPLGRQGDLTFERCRACGRILLYRHGQAWILRPHLPAA